MSNDDASILPATLIFTRVSYMKSFQVDSKTALKSLGGNLRKIRQREGILKSRLARQTGIDAAILSRIEHGRRLPNLPQLVSLSRALKVPIQSFLTGNTRAGVELEDVAIEAEALGIADLFVPQARVPGAFRAPEEVLAILVSGHAPQPRIISAIPAVLAWNPIDNTLLRAFAQVHDPRAVQRLAWLADVLLTIHAGEGFPGGCQNRRQLEKLTRRTSRPVTSDDLGYPVKSSKRLPPAWLRWKITYDADLQTFRKRAEDLLRLLTDK